MPQKPLTKLDFDEVAALARHDPEAYEQYRLDAVEQLISSASSKNQQQLRRIQWRIDQVRKRAPDATAACVKIYQMMWDSFIGDNGFVDIICNGNVPSRNASDKTPKAKVLSFLDDREQSKKF